MERISYTERKTNEEVLELVGERRTIMETIIKRKKKWIGHVLRTEGIMRDVIEGRMEGRRSRGRPRLGMLDELKEGSYVKMKRRAGDRADWRCWVPKTCRKTEH